MALVLTLRLGEAVAIGGVHGQHLNLKDAEVVVRYIGVVDQGRRIQLQITADGKAIQRTDNL